MRIARPFVPTMPDIPDDCAEGSGRGRSIGSRSEPEARSSSGPYLRLMLSDHFVSIHRRPWGGPADYWAGQRTTGGPVGAALASARFPTGSSVTWS
jgi:hypothetical protein